MRSAEWLLIAKALTQEGLAEQGWRLRDQSSPELVGQWRRLAGLRSRLAELTVAAPASSEQARDQVQRLAEEERSLSQRLLASTAQTKSESSWLEIAALRMALPEERRLRRNRAVRQITFRAGSQATLGRRAIRRLGRTA
jgi:hypothetical protein